MKCALMLCVFFLSKTLFADSADLARQLERAKQHVKAAEAYEALLDQEPENKDWIKGAARNRALAGQWDEVTRLYDRYLEKYPDDSAVKAYNGKVKASLESRKASRMNLENPFEGREPKRKYVKLQFELLTPQIIGFDLSYYINRNHNIGLGYVSAGTASGSYRTSVSVMHPRWRYYRSRWYWDSFYEVGATFANIHQDYLNSGYYGSPATEYYDEGFTTGDVAVGANYTRGAFTIEFMLSLMVGNIYQKTHFWSTATPNGSGGYNYTYRDTTQSLMGAIILPGVGVGLVF